MESLKSSILQVLGEVPVADIRELRYAMGCPDTFDDVLLSLADDGKVVLAQDAMREAYDDETAAEYITDGPTFFTCAMLS